MGILRRSSHFNPIRNPSMPMNKQSWTNHGAVFFMKGISKPFQTQVQNRRNYVSFIYKVCMFSIVDLAFQLNTGKFLDNGRCG